MRNKWTILCLTISVAVTGAFTGCAKQSGTVSSQSHISAASDDNGIFDTGSDPFGNAADSVSSGASTASTASGKATSSKSTASVTTTTNSKPLASFIQEAASRMPKVNLTDKTITILSHAQHTVPDVLAAAYPGFTINNVQVSDDMVLTRFVTMVNAGTPPDLFWGNYTPQVIAKQYVQPWDSYINFSSDLWKDVKVSNDNWKIGGKYYYAVVQPGRQNVFMYNVKLLKAKGITEPAELFKQGKWDWDALADMTGKLTVDSNNDGTPEQYGLALDGNAFAFLFSAGTDFVKFTNGQPVNMVKSADVTRAMAFYIKLNKDYKLYTGANPVDAFDQGKVAIVNTQKWVVINHMSKIASGDVMYTTTPKDPSTSVHYTAEETPGYFLPIKAKNVNGAIAYLTALRFGQTDAALKAKSEAESVSTGTTNKTYNDMEDLIMSKTTPVQLGWTFLDITKQVNEMNNRPLQGESWSTVAAEISPQIDAAIKTYKTNTST